MDSNFLTDDFFFFFLLQFFFCNFNDEGNNSGNILIGQTYIHDYFSIFLHEAQQLNIFSKTGLKKNFKNCTLI